MTPEQFRAVQALAQGLESFENTDNLPDDLIIHVEHHGCQYELVTDEDVLRLGHLVTVLSFFRDKDYI